MNHRTIISTLAVLLAAPSVPRIAEAMWVESSGLSCRMYYDDVRLGHANLSYGSRGISNPSATDTTRAICPLNLGETVDSYNPQLFAVVWYTDNSSSTSVGCTFDVIDQQGNWFYTPPVWTCASEGGCATEDPGYMGSGYLAIYLTGDLTNHNVNYDVTFYCQLPPVDPYYGTSSILSYYTTSE